mgnify:CR=1 FL=1
MGKALKTKRVFENTTLLLNGQKQPYESFSTHQKSYIKSSFSLFSPAKCSTTDPGSYLGLSNFVLKIHPAIRRQSGILLGQPNNSEQNMCCVQGMFARVF